MLGKEPARRRAHVDLERRHAARIGLGGERVAAALALLQQDVDVLAGEEAEVLVHRQAQAEDRHVGRGLVQPLDAAGDDPRPHAMDLAHLDREIAERLRLAKERIALRLVAVGQIRGVHRAVVDLAFQYGSPAGAADPGAAAVRQHVAGIQPCLQHRLALVDFVAVPAGLQCDAMSHDFSLAPDMPAGCAAARPVRAARPRRRCGLPPAHRRAGRFRAPRPRSARPAARRRRAR